MKEISDFGNRLKEQRKKLGFTQAQMAEKCGVSGRMWGDYERGKYFPRNENLIAIEKAGIDVNYVMYGEYSTDFKQPENSLNAEELELLEIFRQLGKDRRSSLLEYAQFQLAQEEKKATEDNQIQEKYGTYS